MKFNPFKPNGMAGPDMFVGRVDEIETIEKCLFQTMHGNPQHFLIQGERGIGKSSLMLTAKILAQGEALGVNYTKKFNFLCVSVDLGKCGTQLQVIQKIGRGLKTEIGRHSEIKRNAGAFWDFLTNWEVMGVKYNKAGPAADTDEASHELVVQLSRFIESVEDLHGVVILLDEADAPDIEADLGAFLKLTAERLQRESCNKVLFGLAGLPNALLKMKASHESSPRLFEILTLETLEIDERRTVIERGIARANETNEVKISIDETALEYLCDMSEGYPHFLQQFSYCAFEANTDNVIDIGDIVEGAYQENGAINQLGAKFFSDMYHAKISSDDYRRVLNIMANHSDDWLKRGQIQKETGLSEHTVTNALRTLLSKNIILKDESRLGFYRLPTKSFAVWINATKREGVEKS
jgi:hypothetical protein